MFVIGILKYLGSGLIRGVGPIYASRIVDLFGENTFVDSKFPGYMLFSSINS